VASFVVHQTQRRAPAWLDSRGVSQGVDPAGHLATEKMGCQKLSGQKRIEMKY
jgi:hypothetical protein